MIAAFNFLARFYRPNDTVEPGEIIHVRRLAKEFSGQTDGLLRDHTERLRRRPDMLEAIALVVESIRRSHGLVAFDVQIAAGLALAKGLLAEMATGEGKTLAALLPTFYFSLRGRGVHVATANTYLATRDADFATSVFAHLGLTVGLLRDRDRPAEKRAAYARDITYGVGTEFGFDYLRDQLAIRASGRTEPHYHELFLRHLPPQPELVQRGHAFAVIDEADSVLIDEARSPLIISTTSPRPSATPEIYRRADEAASDLELDRHYSREPASGRLVLTRDGEYRTAEKLDEISMGQLRRIWSHYIENALHVRHHLRRDVHYIISEGRVVIVDEFTGRLCTDRMWRDGLHQAVEAYAGTTITEENSSEATISRPAYFALYEKTCGLSGTLAEAAGELRSGYALSIFTVPLARPCRRILLPDRIFTTRAFKHSAVAHEVAERHAKGQPILVGTRTIENSEALEKVLAPLGLKLKLLNARQDDEEARIIATAGEPGAITIATNMAGRGAHIPIPEASQQVGGLHVIALERHESARIDRQLVGRAARQGEPGSAQFFLSLEDHLIAHHAPKLAQRIARRATTGGVLPASVAADFRRVQYKIEMQDRKQRLSLATHHRWLNELKQSI